MAEAVTGKVPARSLIIGIDGHRLSSQDSINLQHPAVGGVILFTRNYQSPEQLTALCRSIKQLRQPELLICVDQEGGRVQRFQAGFTRLPPLAVYGDMHREDSARACDYAYRHGRIMAAELRARGVDLSFAPVLDVQSASNVIGDRAFSPSPYVIAELGAAMLGGMHDAGMAAVGKHFPGHGTVLADSHHEVVTDSRSLEQLEAHDLIPFERLCQQLDGVMMAHVCYPCVAPQPAGYAQHWIVDILRARLGFDGAVLSDDLDMLGGAAVGGLPERLLASIRAGCDLALVCQPASATGLLNVLDAGQIAGQARQLYALHPSSSALSMEEMQTVGEWRQWQTSIAALCA